MFLDIPKIEIIAIVYQATLTIKVEDTTVRVVVVRQIILPSNKFALAVFTDRQGYI